jgi:hypothetical protein
MYVRYLHRAKVMAQLATGALIRALDANCDELIYITHRKMQEFWYNIVTISINGRPRHDDYTAAQCRDPNVFNGLVDEGLKAKYAACHAWYILWGGEIYYLF